MYPFYDHHGDEPVFVHSDIPFDCPVCQSRPEFDGKEEHEGEEVEVYSCHGCEQRFRVCNDPDFDDGSLE